MKVFGSVREWEDFWLWLLEQWGGDMESYGGSMSGTQHLRWDLEKYLKLHGYNTTSDPATVKGRGTA